MDGRTFDIPVGSHIAALYSLLVLLINRMRVDCLVVLLLEYVDLVARHKSTIKFSVVQSSLSRDSFGTSSSTVDGQITSA